MRRLICLLTSLKLFAVWIPNNAASSQEICLLTICREAFHLLWGKEWYRIELQSYSELFLILQSKNIYYYKHL